jgi:hypothetical protein
MGKGEYHYVCVVDDVIKEHVGEASKANAPEPIAEERPASGVCRDTFYRSVDFLSEFEA